MFCTRGTIDERISVILSSLGQSPSDSVDIAYPLIKEVECSTYLDFSDTG